MEAADESLQAADSSSYKLGTAERLQLAVMLHVILLDQVIDAHCRIAVCDIEATTCRADRIHEIMHFLLALKGEGVATHPFVLVLYIC